MPAASIGVLVPEGPQGDPGANVAAAGKKHRNEASDATLKFLDFAHCLARMHAGSGER